MAQVGGSARRRAPALLEAARARYESLHIWDDVFRESGPDSGGNPFYSTSAASRSSSAASSDAEQERPGPPAASRLPRSAGVRRGRGQLGLECHAAGPPAPALRGHWRITC
ncbi:piggyBac transposable element-derived protein 5-like [Mustela putorius furo]|uniref:PiggyBac transposable element-derived protein 5-like n=1 Tax=Mustela putorius furo TaxID=9669 RepID=A0A8U0RDV6_MUSPF|nr:piggyBac transposable element-derived protein 5-like [Mustela putorius furo]